MRGGARPGAGAKKGVQRQSTREKLAMAEQAAAEGITPLEVMLRTMRKAWDAGDDPTLDSLTQLQHRVAACTIAKDAAPYIHPRLAATELTGKDGSALTIKVVKCA
jgi:hypothetical protein